jgi:hypothetical protein
MPVFTVETARKAALASVAVRAAKALRRFEPASAPLAAPLPTVDDYTKLRLACVRAQLGQVDKAILAESGKDHPDGQRLNWLAQAQDRLSEQERKLAGRPLPGSRRPRDERSRDLTPPPAVPIPAEEPPQKPQEPTSCGVQPSIGSVLEPVPPVPPANPA